MTEWKYLEHKAFGTRQAITAWLLREVPTIIEIGSYKTGLSTYVTPWQSLIMIDSRLDAEVGPNQIGIRQDFPLDVTRHTRNPYAIVLLGMDLRMDAPGWEYLFSLVKGSVAAVVEFPPEHAPSEIQFGQLLGATGKKVTLTVGLSLGENQFGDMVNSAPLMTERKLFLLE